MAYRTELEARIAKKATKAIDEYQMIEDGDRVMVGLSGGKDSWALLQILDVLRQRAPVRFSLIAVRSISGLPMLTEWPLCDARRSAEGLT